MASTNLVLNFCRFLRRFTKKRTFSNSGSFSKFFKYNRASIAGLSTACVLSFSAFYVKRNGILHVVYAEGGEEGKGKHSPTYREMRFMQFASVEYKGITYMTPQDFLESVTEEMPRPRIGRATLTESDVESWLKRTPNRRYGSTKLFRNLHDKGLISYTEYLFLLCVLTKSKSGFRIAFNMFDTDGNQIVDKKEFLVLETFFTLPPQERKFVPRERTKLQGLLDVNTNICTINKLHIYIYL